MHYFYQSVKLLLERTIKPCSHAGKPMHKRFSVVAVAADVLKTNNMYEYAVKMLARYR